MSKKRLPESVRVLEYFQTAPLDSAQELLVLCQHALKKRKPQAAPRAVSDPKVATKTRKTRQENSTGRLTPVATATDPSNSLVTDTMLQHLDPVPAEDLPI